MTHEEYTLSVILPTLFRCTTRLQFNQYHTLNKMLFKANDIEISNLTGCVPKCDHFIYKSEPVGSMTNYKTIDPSQNNTVVMQLYFPTGTYQVREEVSDE